MTSAKMSVFLVDALLQIQEQNADKAIKCTAERKSYDLSQIKLKLIW